MNSGKNQNRANVGQYRQSVTSKPFRSFHSKSGESKLKVNSIIVTTLVFHHQRFGIYSLLAPDLSIPLSPRGEITTAVISFWSTAGCNI